MKLVNTLGLKLSGHCDLEGSTPFAPTYGLVAKLVHAARLDRVSERTEGSTPSEATTTVHYFGLFIVTEHSIILNTHSGRVVELVDTPD